MKTIFILIVLILFNTIMLANVEATNDTKNDSKKVIEIKKIEKTPNNIWLKTYKNYKKYNTILININKIEQEVERNKRNINKVQELTSKLSINKSKLSLYEKNQNFNDLLKNYKFEIIDITIYDYLFNVSSNELQKKITKYELLKKEFYAALSYLQEKYNKDKKVIKDKKKNQLLLEQINYFNEYSENIEKTYQSFLDLQDELTKKYNEYENEVFIKHIITLGSILAAYISYKFLLFVFFYIIRNKDNQELEQNYRKILSLLFVITILIFVVVRYMDDLLYIITFLGVVAAALTLATREIILNIAGAIYIFFSNVIRVGDRVMVQFETKHVVGDIVSISLIKMKLNEVCDYSNIKDIKNVGRTIYIPNSYMFTKVFYNYSLKQNGIINDLIEFEFDKDNDFDFIEKATENVLKTFSFPYTIAFSLNSAKTGIVGLISYQVNYKVATKKRGEVSIALLKEYTSNENIKLKTTVKKV
ncbi:mechanosensitive ion channel [Poseidonibacter lekithochrous]|uniref:mechanosensitive ion channel domain-containing protein n=1 Tax=Poseidonibacter TaxID=2321187 RepID=UPI001C0A6111|nr:MULTISPECIES: mechanosensitive ion channel domain-containing protein [Poseidonibacter]MBU3014978.1 mechanosensitive ion channel [Poseidonibacter lekithochrous]MDO6828275.1 mechanosensitive ion channel [Poseidonibacter sp. 1_MG-2023]